MEDVSVMSPVAKLTSDIRSASASLGDDEARFLVDAYYQMQRNRIRSGNQIRAVGDAEPHAVLTWLMEQDATLENQIKGALERYAKAHKAGPWMFSVKGIGPVLSAGLLAHIDITKAPTVGHIWRFAGLDPTVKWGKGEKRPWNASLKTLCWKIGESFVKVSGDDAAFYGCVYRERKELEIRQNEAGLYSQQAAKVLEERRIGKETDAYKNYSAGRLPPAHIHARAKRYAVKLFLSSLHMIWYFRHYGVLPAKPYVIEVLGHAHFVSPPNIEIVPGLSAALSAQGPRSVC